MKWLSLLSLVLLLSSCSWFFAPDDTEVAVSVEPLSREASVSLSIDGQVEEQLVIPAGERIEARAYYFREDDLLSVTASYTDNPSSEVDLSVRLTLPLPLGYGIFVSETSAGLSLSCADSDTATEGCPQP